jgi:acyl-CoA reductase-like NAD-dependent aldehyde dehydrogenase
MQAIFLPALRGSAVIARPVSPSAVDDLPTDLPAVLDQLVDQNPALAIAMTRAIGGSLSPTLRAAARRLIEALGEESRLDNDVDEVVTRAVRAQEAFEHWTDERVDGLLADLAQTFARRAEQLAVVTVGETRMGNVADKILKNRFASESIYESLAGQVAQGPLAVDAERRVTEIASPVGVVFAVLPVTSPVAAAIFKTMIAIKTRNALILSFPHRAFGVGQFVGGIVRDLLTSHGAPAGLVQAVQLMGRKPTRHFMSHPRVSLVLATGGPGLVKAAYSSGTPAIGVGPGNAPAWVCADADVDAAARAIVDSKSFDNGLICGAEHNLVVDSRVAMALADALKKHGAAILTAAENADFFLQSVERKTGEMRRDVIGQAADVIARVIGITRPYPIRLLVIPCAADADGFYAREKLAPVLSMFTVAGEEEGLRRCRALLQKQGAGHTAIIHSSNPSRIERFARAMPASRILVNTSGAQGCCGMTTGLERSLTLGCGTFGGNSTTDNVTYRHLLNIKRVAHSIV